MNDEHKNLLAEFMDTLSQINPINQLGIKKSGAQVFQNIGYNEEGVFLGKLNGTNLTDRFIAICISEGNNNGAFGLVANSKEHCLIPELVRQQVPVVCIYKSYVELAVIDSPAIDEIRQRFELIGGKNQSEVQYAYAIPLIDNARTIDVINYIKAIASAMDKMQPNSEFDEKASELLKPEHYKRVKKSITYIATEGGPKVPPEPVKPPEPSTPKDPNMNTALNTILYGPPGTGKTYSTIEKAIQIIEGKGYSERGERKDLKEEFDRLLSANQIGFTTFHPSYSYEDFVIGYKPHNVKGSDGTTQISYEPTAGIFYKMCKLAYENDKKNYVLIIDEINRGNLSSIFGELMTLIEDSKRIGADEAIRLALPIQMPTDNKSDFLDDGKFGVPKNLYVIGTMNTADRSAALMDVALRRRFVFEYMPPNYELLDFSVNNIHIGKLLKNLNVRIEKRRDRDHTIGHASFFKLEKSNSSTVLRHIFKQSILPLLEEYFYEDWKGLEEVVPRLITEKDGIYRWSDCLDHENKIDEFLDALSELVK